MSSENPIILIIEDTLEFARLTQLILKRFGYESHHVADGESAIAFFEEYQPHVILMDLNLPGMSGWDVMEQMTMMFGEKTIPVIVTSAYSDSANRTVGKLQGVFKYLVKPIDPKNLVQTIEDALNLRNNA